MKKWTNKFINTRKKLDVNNLDEKNLKNNAKNANNTLGIPEDLWIELSNKFPKSKLMPMIGHNSLTTFLAGFAVGWAEKNNKIK